MLVTAFRPFDGSGLNSAQEALNAALPQLGPGTVTIEPPVSWGRDIRAVWPLIDLWRPRALLLLGQAGGAELWLETRARNRRYDQAAEGELRPILLRGAADYPTTADAEDLLGCLTAAGLPARLSDDAGSYLCNHLYYHVLHRLDERGWPTQAIFMHLPLLPEQAALCDPPRESLPLEDAARAVAIVAERLRAAGQPRVVA